jgi:hypothetical protein
VNGSRHLRCIFALTAFDRVALVLNTGTDEQVRRILLQTFNDQPLSWALKAVGQADFTKEEKQAATRSPL